MTVLLWMMAAALLLAGVALGAFIWSLRSGQYDDPAGSAARILDDQPPLP